MGRGYAFSVISRGHGVSRLLVAALLAWMPACDDEGEGADALAPSRAPGRASVQQASEDDAADEDEPERRTKKRRKSPKAKRPEWPTALNGLPEMDLSPRERAHTDLSRRLFKRGLDLLRKDDPSGAVDRFFESIEVDPGNVDSYYNLACALSLTGDARAAVALLDQLRQAGCGSCLGKVLKARRDPDFDGIRKDKGFVAVVSDVETELPEPEQAAESMLAWIGGGRKAESPLALDPRRKITVRVGCPQCAGPGAAEVGLVRGEKGLRSWVERKRRAFSGGIAEGALEECKGKCCTFAEPEATSVSPDTVYPVEVCFRMETGMATSLSKLELRRYPPPGGAPELIDALNAG